MTDLTLVGLPGASVGRGTGYRGEQVTSVGRRFVTKLRAGRAEAWLADHPELRVAGEKGALLYRMR
ncbi:hypothetical protein [Micromonospora fluostatini]|uniref:hypothetical protein n=1 Tax=Micromonospora sp. JCM 30529 TaxID=3421643 RepID=UPI003D16C657